MKILLGFVLAVSLCISGFSQQQTATTKDGKKVILREDGTWEYANKTQVTRRKNSTLDIEAAIVYANGPEPVARGEFVLLDDSLEVILLNAGLKPQRGNKTLTETWVFSKSHPDLYQDFVQSSDNALAKHVIETLRTDFDGKAQFSPIIPGVYYIAGMHHARKGIVAWNYKVEIKQGRNKIILDQDNTIVGY